ncbi:MAG: T9SS type A sorting domain-containing protein [Bacteroidota bacterium]
MKPNVTLSVFLKKALLSCSILAGLIAPSWGQITITEAYLTQDFNKSYRHVLYETNLDIDPQLTNILAATGDNQVWDFTNLNYVDSTVIIEELVPIDPNDPLLNDPNLANSTFIWKNTIYPVTGGLDDTTMQYLYARLDNGAWTVNGSLSIFDMDMDGSIDTFLQWLSPPRLEVPFPVMTTSAWFDSTSLVQNIQGMEFVSSIIKDSSWVEGWGTLITPIGSIDALRVRHKDVNQIPGSPSVEVGTDIDFVGVNNGISASIVVEDGRAFYSDRRLIDSMTTSVIDLIDFDFHLYTNYPNPASHQTIIPFSLEKPGKIECSILDMQGKTHYIHPNRYYPQGDHEIVVSCQGWASGNYIIQLKKGNQVQHRKMHVLK